MNSDDTQQGAAVHSESDVSVSSDQSGTSLSVNGERMSVGPNESVNRSYESDDGSTHVDISIQNSSSGDNSDDDGGSRSRSRFDVRTESSSSTSIRGSTNIRNSD